MLFLDYTQLKRKRYSSSSSSDIAERQTLDYDDYYLQGEKSFEGKNYFPTNI